MDVRRDSSETLAEALGANPETVRRSIGLPASNDLRTSNSCEP